MRRPADQARARAPRVLALVVLVTPRQGPHGEVLDHDARAGLAGRADEADGGAERAVGAIAVPFVEGEARVEDAGTGLDGEIGPVGVDVETVCVVVADEVGEVRVGD